MLFLNVPFNENAVISMRNLLAGRPLYEGWLPSSHIPDPVLPDPLVLEIIDS